MAHYAFGPYRIDSGERILRFEGRRVALAPKVTDTLLALLAESDRIVSKAELMERVWPGAFVEEANLTQNVYVLRKIFAERAGGARIENVPKRGYRLVVPPADAPPTAAAAPQRARREPRFARALPAAMLAGGLLLGIGGPVAAPRASADASPYALPPNDLQHYLLGRYYLSRATPADLNRSIAEFAALARDRPQSAFGYAGLADGFTSRTFQTGDAATGARLGAQAVALATQAVAFGPDCADAYAALGAAQSSIEHDHEAAARSFETALRLDPRNFDALVWYGTERMNDGRVAEARRLFARALSVDPRSPGAIASLAWADFLGRHFADAAIFAQQLLRARRLESIARITLATSYVELGDYARALPVIAAMRRAAETRTQGAALLSQIYALRGTRRRALDALARLETETDPDRIGSWDVLALAAAYARAGREDVAFVWLARVRSAERRQLARDPRFDRLRRDRRFADWVRG